MSASTVQTWTNPAAAWQFACRQDQLLPASHSQLLELLGCSSRAVLWAAASAAGVAYGDAAAQALLECAQQLHCVLHLFIQFTRLCDWQQQVVPAADLQNARLQMPQQLPQQLFLKLPAVLLYAAAHHPNHSLVEWQQDCLEAANLGIDIVLTTCEAFLDSNRDRSAAQLAALQDLTESDLLPSALQLSGQILKTLSSTHTSSAAASTSSNSSGIGSGPVPMGDQDTTGSTLPGGSDIAVSDLIWLVKQLAVCGSYLLRARMEQQQQGMEGSTSNKGSRDDASSSSNGLSFPSAAITNPPWVPHAVPLGQLLEAQLRISGSSHSGRPEDVTALYECRDAAAALCMPTDSLTPMWIP